MADRGAGCWEIRLSGSERGWGQLLLWIKYCGTAGKPGGNRENKPYPKAWGVPSLLEKTLKKRHCSFCSTLHFLHGCEPHLGTCTKYLEQLELQDGQNVATFFLSRSETHHNLQHDGFRKKRSTHPTELSKLFHACSLISWQVYFTFNRTHLGSWKKIIIQSCWSFCPSSVVQQQLRSLLCAYCYTTEYKQKFCPILDNYLFPAPLIPLIKVFFIQKDIRNKCLVALSKSSVKLFTQVL